MWLCWRDTQWNDQIDKQLEFSNWYFWSLLLPITIWSMAYINYCSIALFKQKIVLQVPFPLETLPDMSCKAFIVWNPHPIYKQMMTTIQFTHINGVLLLGSISHNGMGCMIFWKCTVRFHWMSCLASLAVDATGMQLSCSWWPVPVCRHQEWGCVFQYPWIHHMHKLVFSSATRRCRYLNGN
jgi:hypothetical protein